MPGDLPAAVKDRVQLVNNLDAFKGDFQVALVETMLVSSVRGQLAGRDGALAAVIDTNADETIPLWRLFAVREYDGSRRQRQPDDARRVKVPVVLGPDWI